MFQFLGEEQRGATPCKNPIFMSPRKRSRMLHGTPNPHGLVIRAATSMFAQGSIWEGFLRGPLRMAGLPGRRVLIIAVGRALRTGPSITRSAGETHHLSGLLLTTDVKFKKITRRPVLYSVVLGKFICMLRAPNSKLCNQRDSTTVLTSPARHLGERYRRCLPTS